MAEPLFHADHRAELQVEASQRLGGEAQVIPADRHSAGSNELRSGTRISETGQGRGSGKWKYCCITILLPGIRKSADGLCRREDRVQRWKSCTYFL